MDKTTIFEKLSDKVSSKIEGIRQQIAEQIFVNEKQDEFYIVKGLVDFEIVAGPFDSMVKARQEKKNMKGSDQLSIVSSKELKAKTK
jgi:hypothetical protein